MTPINPKDRPKVIALAITSVLMFGFFLMTVLGAVSKKPGVQQTPTASPAAALAPPPPPPLATGPAVVASATPSGKAPIMANLPDRNGQDAGSIDPFRHVLPDPAEIARLQAAATHPAVPRPMRIVPMSGNLPPLAGNIGGGPAGGVAVTPVQPQDPTIRLDGVVTDRDRFAMVTFNDRSDMYRVGSKIGGMFTVLGVSNGEASFLGPKGIFRLEVGDERAATAPVAKEPAPKSASKRGHADPSQTEPSQVAHETGRTNLPSSSMAEYATLPLPSIDGPATGRGH